MLQKAEEERAALRQRRRNHSQKRAFFCRITNCSFHSALLEHPALISGPPVKGCGKNVIAELGQTALPAGQHALEVSTVML